MFTTLVLSVYCFSLVLTSAIDPKFIDGKQYTINSVDTTYTQRVSIHGQCMVEVHDQDEKLNTLSEGEIVKIKNKWFKVEDCRLNRAYLVACGSKFFFQVRDLVCSYVEQHYGRKITRRQTQDDLINVIDTSFYGVCCQSACTIAELVQYCPVKW